MKIYVETSPFLKRFFITSPINRNKRFVITSGYNKRLFITLPVVKNKRFFITSIYNKRFFITQTLPEDDIECCKYPSWLSNYRALAISYFHKLVFSRLQLSYTKESYGKKDNSGYIIASKINAFIEYCSVISLKMREGEEAGLNNNVKYYYDLYDLDCIINYFKCKDVNVLPVISIFKIDQYNPSVYNFDSYTWAYNIEIDDEIIMTTKAFRDYYTNQSITPILGENIHSLNASQTSFTTTKNIKVLNSFLINGIDRIDKVNFSGNTVTYTPTGGSFPYVIQNTDTIIVNYTYES